MTFYTQVCKSIDKDDFIKIYSQYYYSKNSAISENLIDNILQNGITSKIDLFNIFAWKIGGIDHKKSRLESTIIYRDGWNACKYTGESYGRTLELENFIDYIFSKYVEKDIDVCKENYADIYAGLYNNKCKGIGPVNLINIIYFLSKGKLPIYDRYADMALTAILEDKDFNSTIKYSEMPEIIDSAMRRYKEYIGKLEKVFGDDYTKNRNIDRALWVYGHMFNN